MKALYAEAGVAGASSHSERRTLITRLPERGVDLKSIAQIAGHTSIRTSAMYVEANPTRSRTTRGFSFCRASQR
jgi:integrase/recombinase XerD